MGGFRGLLCILLACSSLDVAHGVWLGGAVMVASAPVESERQLALRPNRLYKGKGAMRRQILKDAEKLKRGEPLEGTKGAERGAPQRPKRFIPTDDWQEVPKGTPIPKGLHIKMDLEEGKTYARLMQPTMPTPIPLSTATRPRRSGPELALPWLGAGGGAATGAALLYRASQAPGGLRKAIAPALLGYLAVVNVASALTVVHDKSQAEQGRWRVPERQFHLLALGGGWAGALVAMKLCRHKTAKGSFKGPFALASGANLCGCWAVLSQPVVKSSFAMLASGLPF